MFVRLPGICTGLSGSVLGKLPSRFQDEKHIFCENYVGFSCIARVVLNRTWKYFQVEIRTICSLKNKGHQRASKSRMIFHIGGPHMHSLPKLYDCTEFESFSGHCCPHGAVTSH